MGRFGGSLRLMRPANCLMMGLAVVVGAALASPDSLNMLLPNLFFGFITGFMLTAASMTLNDYYDREIDAINEPNRPIPSGLIKPREALTLSLIFTATGFVTAAMDTYLWNSFFCFTIAVIAWIIFVVYTTGGKRSGLPGNFLVSLCVSIPFIYGSAIVVNSIKLNVLIFVSMVFLSNVGREITKGIADAPGDETQNVKTLAVRFGSRIAAVVATLFYLSAVIFEPVSLAIEPCLFSVHPFSYNN